MPHLTGAEINAFGSAEAWRLIAQKQGVSGLNAALSQVGGGGLGYTVANQGDVWSAYTAVGDSYDAAHGFFGGIVYTIGAVGETTPDVSVLTPVGEEELLPGDEGEEPSVDDEHFGHIPGTLGALGLGEARDIFASWFGEFIVGLHPDTPTIKEGLSRNPWEGITGTEENAVARFMGMRLK